ncbi:sodium:proton antiporter [Hasllibacter sp. MH4015]|uniref:cation:proton antiporter n=1 Tax=Hasllibacter sp. MH4015 TaxID=2854029 RepID=UPI001CD31443|nr:cation:proton antiporter [Hasllibacter sp. MH4015]
MGYLIIAMFLMAFCMVANRLSRTILTAPMVFLGFGLLVAQLGMVPEAGSEAALHIVAEVALIVLLFLDAAQIDQRALLRRRVWPVRMLAIGLPLGFLLGTALGLILLPGWPLAVVALVAAILVPTDAALGQAVVTNPDIPERPRRALTVESGLNDGLALPLVLMMAAVAAPAADAPATGWALFALGQIVLGPLVGFAVGWVGGKVLLWAKRTAATAAVFEGIGALALAATAYLAATQVGGNGFISAFAAGLGFGAVVRGQCAFVYEFTESEGQLLSWTAFFLLGAVLMPDALAHLSWANLALILGSLLLVRPLAIWISLLGTDAAPATRVFFGWFGPRGLATALFALLVVDQLDHDIAEDVLHIAINAVWISALLHGVTALPGAKWYAGRMAKASPDDAEMQADPPSSPAFPGNPPV